MERKGQRKGLESGMRERTTRNKARQAIRRNQESVGLLSHKWFGEAEGGDALLLESFVTVGGSV